MGPGASLSQATDGSACDKVVVVTGASNGLGLETAEQLAAQGAEIVMVCRDRSRGERGQSQIAQVAAAVVLLGHRPGELDPDVASENARLDPDIYAITAPEVRERGASRVGRHAAMQLAGRPAWLHLDLDVLDQDVLPAVSYPQPLGLDWRDLVELAQPLASAPNLLGVSVADFNPDGDPDGSYAALTVAELAGLFSDYPKR